MPPESVNAVMQGTMMQLVDFPTALVFLLSEIGFSSQLSEGLCATGRIRTHVPVRG